MNNLKFKMLKNGFLQLCLCFLSTICISQPGSLPIADKDRETNYFPAMSLENPFNSGELGMIVVGGTIENKTRIANKPDANAAIYVGLGDPENLIGAGATVNIYGLTNKHGELNNLGEGSLSFHLNKFFFNNKLLLEAGLDNAFSWGGNPVNRKYITYQKSFYFSGNYLFYLKQSDLQTSFSYLSVTAGAGNGYFRRDKNYVQNKSGSFNPFISIATPIFKGTNLVTEWNGYELGAGISSIPLQTIPVMFTFEVTDLLIDYPRFVLAVSIPFHLGKSKIEGRPIGIKAFRTERTI